jgi:hypothetical protein
MEKLANFDTAVEYYNPTTSTPLRAAARRASGHRQDLFLLYPLFGDTEELHIANV